MLLCVVAVRTRVRPSGAMGSAGVETLRGGSLDRLGTPMCVHVHAYQAPQGVQVAVPRLRALRSSSFIATEPPVF